MLTISCRYRVNIGTLTYLVNIVYIVDIAMLTISYRYRVDIGRSSLSCLVYMVDIAMLTISCRYLVDIGILSYLVYIIYIVDIAIRTISCRHRYPVILRLHRLHRRHREIKWLNKRKFYMILALINHNKCPWRCPRNQKSAYIVTSQARLDQLRTSKINQNSYSFHESRCRRYGRYKHDCVYIVYIAISTMSTMLTW